MDLIKSIFEENYLKRINDFIQIPSSTRIIKKKFIKSFSRANSYTGSWILKEYTSRAYSHKGIKDFILQLFLEQILRKGSRILPPGTRLCKQCSTSLQSLFKVNIIFIISKNLTSSPGIGHGYVWFNQFEFMKPFGSLIQQSLNGNFYYFFYLKMHLSTVNSKIIKAIKNI